MGFFCRDWNPVGQASACGDTRTHLGSDPFSAAARGVFALFCGLRADMGILFMERANDFHGSRHDEYVFLGR